MEFTTIILFKEIVDCCLVSLSLPKRGSREHIRGFIIHKLLHYGCVIRRGGKPRGHLSTDNVKKGYAKSDRGKFPKILKKLEKEGLICSFPHGGDGEPHVSVVIDDDVITKAIEIANKYRLAEGLPPWNREFKEVYESL